MSRRGSVRDYGSILHGHPVTIWKTYICLYIVLSYVCGVVWKWEFLKIKFLKRFFFLTTLFKASMNIWLRPQSLHVASFFPSVDCSMSLCQADFNNLYLSKQPFHVDLRENGISASCHLMFSSRPFTQVSFLAGPQQAVGGSSRLSLE